MKKLKLLGIIIGLSISITGCSENFKGGFSDINPNLYIDESNEIGDSINEDKVIEKRKEIVLGMKRPKTLNPLLSNDISVTTVLKLVFLDIVSLSDDNQLQYNLIDSYTFDKSIKTATIVLKDNIQWQDGSGYVDADDFIYSLHTLANAPKDGIYKNFSENISWYRKIDDRTVTLTVKNSMAGMPYYLEFPIIPQDFFSKYDTINGVHFAPLVGNGLYVNTVNNINGEMTLVDSSSDNTDTNIETITIKYLEDIEAMLHSFEQNKIDIIVENIQLWNKYHIDKEVNLTEFNNMELELVGFDFKKEYISDINFRKAVELVIPYEQIINTIYLGFCNPSRSVLPTNHFAYYSDINFVEENKNEAINKLRLSSYGGEPIKLIISNSTVQNEKVAKLIVDNLREIGINASYELQESELLYNNIENGEFDLFIGNFKMSTLPNYTTLFGAENKLGYNNEVINELIKSSLDVGDIEDYKIILRELQKNVKDELPIIPLFHINKALISADTVTTFKPSSYNNPYGNFDRFINDRE